MGHIYPLLYKIYIYKRYKPNHMINNDHFYRQEFTSFGTSHTPSQYFPFSQAVFPWVNKDRILVASRWIVASTKIARENVRCRSVLVTICCLFSVRTTGWNETWIKYKEWPGSRALLAPALSPSFALSLFFPTHSRVIPRGYTGAPRRWWFSILQQSFAGSPGGITNALRSSRLLCSSSCPHPFSWSSYGRCYSRFPSVYQRYPFRLDLPVLISCGAASGKFRQEWRGPEGERKQT